MAKALIEILISARDAASAAIENVRRSSEQAHQATLKAVRNIGLAMTAAGAAGIFFSSKASEAFREVETAWASVATVLEGGVSDVMARFGDSISDITSRLPVQGGEVGALGALYDILSAGITDTADATAVLEVAVKAGAAGMTTAKTAADALTSVLNAYQLSGSEAGRISDILFQTVNLGKVTFEQLAGAIGNVTAISAQLDVPLEDIGAAFATLTRQGINADEVSTGLRATLLAFISPTEQMKEQIAALGFESGAAMVKEIGLAESMRVLNEAVGGNEQALNELFPNVRAFLTVLPLAGQSADAFAGDLALMRSSLGSTEDAFKDVASTADAQMSILSNRFDKAMARIGESTTPAMISLKEAQVSLAEGFASINDATGGAVGAIVAFGSQAAATIGPIIAMTAQLSLLTKGKILAAIASHGLKVAMIAIPIFLLIAAIALLVTHWDEVKAALTRVWDFLVGVLSPAIDTFVGFFRGAFEFLSDVVKGWIELIAKAFEFLVGFFGNIVEGVKKVIGFFADVGRMVWDALLGGFNALKDLLFNLGKWLLENVVLGIWNFLAGLPAAVWNIITSFVNSFVEAFKGIAGRIFDLGKDFVKWIVKGILNMLGPLGDVVRPVLESILGPLTGSPQLNPAIAARFERIGRDMSTSIAHGITDGAVQAERAIGSAVGGLTAASRNSPVNGSGAGSGTTVIVNFNRGSIVTDDPKSFAERVDAALLDTLRRRGVRYGRRG